MQGNLLIHLCTPSRRRKDAEMHTWLLTLSLSSPCGFVFHSWFLPCLLSSLGSCAHGGLQRVSRPLVVQLNWRGFSHKAGAWGRDSTPNPDSSLYWVAPLSSGDRWAEDGFSFLTRFIPNVSYPTVTGLFLCGPSRVSSLHFRYDPGKLSLGLTGYIVELLSGLRMTEMALSSFTNPLSEISNPILIQTGSIYSLILSQEETLFHLALRILASS